ncbi:MAG: pseudaminic acid cytidylyltransferase [Oscillospiraceae bacterium]|nr:pseudaminic acid cytidylyltransferase [Oscillospiraceae bacterium]
MSDIAIITARGGSKRIPKKNIREFCGKPIIAYSIQAAVGSGLFEEVMVSTDSDEIADVARQYGAHIPFMRSEATSNDYATTEDVLKEVIGRYREDGRDFENFCCIYPTAPFVTAEKLRESRELLSSEDVFNVVPMVPFSFPPQRGMVRKGRYIEPAQPEHIRKRSQDLEEILHDCGQFYWCRTAAFLEDPNILFNHTVPFVVPETEVQDIDNPSDWELAELKYRYMISRS